MWNLASTYIADSIASKTNRLKPCPTSSDCSDDDASSNAGRLEGLECPICWDHFNLVENVPYVLWCGHTLCKNCILGLQWAVVKFPTLPLQLPLFISCPWCNHLSFRFVYKGHLKFPRKNYFLLWMVESMNGDRVKSTPTFRAASHLPVSHSNTNASLGNQHHGPQTEPSGPNPNHNRATNYLTVERLHSSIAKSLAFFIHLTAKFPLVLIFLLIVLYVIPASAAILVLYLLITILFALPSFLILYFAYPSLDWLVREVIT